MFHGTQADVKGIGRYTAFNQHIETVTAYSLNNLSYSQNEDIHRISYQLKIFMPLVSKYSYKIILLTCGLLTDVDPCMIINIKGFPVTSL